MPAHELRVDRASHLLEIPRALLLQEKGQEIDLKEQVSELVEQLRVVAGKRRMRDLVRLLDRVRDNRPCGLLPIPGAVATQPLGQALQLEEGLLETVSQWW